MTGFRQSWSLKDSSESRRNESQRTTECQKADTPSPGYQEQQLLRMVQLATQARAKNVDRKEVINKMIFEKAGLIQNKQLDYTSMCSGGQVKENHHSVVGELNIGLNDTVNTLIIDEDYHTGFMIFSAMIYCSETEWPL